MAVSHSVDAPHRVVFSDFRGRITLAEIAAACTKLRNNPEFRESFRQLADFSGVEALDLRPEDLAAISTIYDPFSKKSRRAFVVSDHTTRETVDAYQSISQNPDLRVYGSLLDAIACLDLEFPVLKAASKRNSTLKLKPAEQSSVTFNVPPIHRSTLKHR